MWQEGSIFYEDVENICKAEFVPWDELKGKTLFITGATGLIGSALVKALVCANREKKLGTKIIALVRDLARAKEKFENDLNSAHLSLACGTVEELPEIRENIDYIVHGASQTASQEFVKHAVETINTSILGTMNLLKLAKEKHVRGFVYLSSMEMYGYPKKGHKVKEEEAGALSPLNLRNSYPISKQMCESLCCAYAGEYNVPAKIIRLTQTFGSGINYNDTRIFAYFARCVIEKQDIVLKTKGATERSYLYTTDAVTAILMVLLKGKNGQAYNAADEKTYCSIAEMAEKVAEDGGIKVRYELQDEMLNGFPQTLYMDLDTTLLKKLGWEPICAWGGVKPIIGMYRRMVRSLR